MVDHEKTAAQLSDTVFRMLKALESYEVSPLPREYGVFKKIDAKEQGWLVLLFFPEAAQLNEAIRNGACFSIYEFMRTNFDRMEGLQGLVTHIAFEWGKAPNEDEIEERKKLCDAAFKKLEILNQEAGEDLPEICGICGHHSDDHQVAFFRNEEGNPNTRGWWMCKEEGCNCFRTCDLNLPNND